MTEPVLNAEQNSGKLDKVVFMVTDSTGFRRLDTDTVLAVKADLVQTARDINPNITELFKDSVTPPRNSKAAWEVIEKYFESIASTVVGGGKELTGKYFDLTRDGKATNLLKFINHVAQRVGLACAIEMQVSVGHTGKEFELVVDNDGIRREIPTQRVRDALEGLGAKIVGGYSCLYALSGRSEASAIETLTHLRSEGVINYEIWQAIRFTDPSGGRFSDYSI